MTSGTAPAGAAAPGSVREPAGRRQLAPRRTFDVVCVGNALTDHLAFASEDLIGQLGLDPGGMTLVDIATTERIEAVVGAGEQVPGGTVTNTAVGIASFGGRPAFIGAVATDERGRRYAEDLWAAGVHAALQRFEHDPSGDEAATGRCFIVVTPDAERTMATALGVGGRLDRDGLDEELIASSRLVYFDGYVLDLPDAVALVDRLVEVSRGAGTAIALGLSDAALVARHHARLVELSGSAVDILFANESEAMALSGAGDVQEALEQLRRPGLTVVVTCGPAGAVLASEDEVVTIPPDEVEVVVDRTGAGDLFAAGVCYGLTAGLSIERAGELGALAAGEVISHLGARPRTSLAELARRRGLL
ncbi:MAG TPA: adenosine kinase [Acidimicrobiales bacterium]|nr:adenosine kinase [Acidimicrobiales bacterium]